jgi:hypothetical protein
MKRLGFLELIAISIVILLLGYILYFTNFNTNFSKNSDEWANFATFNSYFTSLISIMILGYISIITYKTTDKFNKLQLKPLLFLALDKPDKVQEHLIDSWYVENGSKSPAMNLLVRHMTSEATYTKWISCISLSEKQRLELFWVRFANKIEICFSDITEEYYYLLDFQDMYGKINLISKAEYLKFLEESKNNRGNNIINLHDKFQQFISSLKQGKVTAKNYLDDFIKPNKLL